jgi:hypothetical protein
MPRSLAALVIASVLMIAVIPFGCGQATRGSAGDAGPPDVRKDAPHDVEGGAPYLESLSVRSAEGVYDVVLTPAFSPGTFDYYVQCAPGYNSLAVSLIASEGATGAIDLTTSSRGELSSQTGFAANQSLTLSVDENQAIVAEVRKADTTTQYWVRCLPSNMATWIWAAHPESGALPTGYYYLVGDLYPVFGNVAYAVAFDGNGVPVWYQPSPRAKYGAGDTDSTGPNTLSFLPFYNEGIGSFTVFDLGSWTATLAPSTAVADQYQVNLHELKRYTNGDYLVLGQPYTYGIDLSGVVVSGAGGTTTVWTANAVISDCAIVEIDTSGNLVGTPWLASNHFETKEVTEISSQNGAAPDGGTAVDVFHCNSIDIDPANGNLLVSARDMDSVFYVEWPSGKVLWKMGGANSSKDAAAYVSVASPFAAQHDARLHGWTQRSSGASGQVSMFDDESGSTTNPARGVVYDVVVGPVDGGPSSDGEGPAVGTATVAWQYAGMGSSHVSGSMRNLSTGSSEAWVIGWGIGATPYVFSVIDASTKLDLLDFYYLDNEPSYRAIPQPLSELSIGDLRATAGLAPPASP